MKIAGRLTSNSMHSSTASVLPFVQTLCLNHGFNLSNLIEGTAFLYSEGIYEDEVDTEINFLCETITERETISEFINKLSNYFYKYESTDKSSQLGFIDMEDTFFRMFEDYLTFHYFIGNNDESPSNLQNHNFFILNTDPSFIKEQSELIDKWISLKSKQ